jgi:phosphopantetheinyl transferase
MISQIIDDFHDDFRVPVHVPRDVTSTGTILAGREMRFLFLEPGMVFYRTMLKEALESPGSFLTLREMEILGRFTAEKRKVEWLGGRLNMKLLLAEHSANGNDFLSFEILPGADGEPVATLRTGVGVFEVPLHHSLSLSHREGASASALCADPDAALGIDVELMEPRSELMLEDYFSGREAKILAGLPTGIHPFRIALAWSLKESVLKARRVGLAVPAKSVVIENFDFSSSTAEATLRDGAGTSRFEARFFVQPPYIITLACEAFI